MLMRKHATIFNYKINKLFSYQIKRQLLSTSLHNPTFSTVAGQPAIGSEILEPQGFGAKSGSPAKLADSTSASEGKGDPKVRVWRQ